jgi:hypothetical protein
MPGKPEPIAFVPDSSLPFSTLLAPFVPEDRRPERCRRTVFRRTGLPWSLVDRERGRIDWALLEPAVAARLIVEAVLSGRGAELLAESDEGAARPLRPESLGNLSFT